MNTRIWCGQPFRHFSALEPKRNSSGRRIEETPQPPDGSPPARDLNRHGDGPFCRLSVPGLPVRPGVHVVTLDGTPFYVGMAAKNLRERWGSRGFGRIWASDRLVVNGQRTNCKVNHRILCAARDGLTIDLWIHETAAPKPLRDALIKELNPPWND